MATTNDYISLPSIVGKGYATFWNTKKTYVVVKGSRASKKSKTTALWHIYHMMKYPLANTLVVRKVDRTQRDSTYSDLQWATHRLHVAHLWDFKVSPLEAVYKPTGQKIMFRGLDDPLKMASVSVPKGVLNFLWIEEAYEIMSESDFDTLDESIRGLMPEGYWKRVTITLNPWNERHWIKKRFFDTEDPDVLALTTNYMINEWLSDTDLKLFEKMKVNNPRRYRVAGLGEWGVVEGLIYENWREQAFEIVDKKTYKEAEDKTNLVCADDVRAGFGLDFGYTNDPSALFCGYVDLERKKIYVADEMYEKGLSNQKIYQKITEMGYRKERITADSAEPKSIDELQSMGLRITGAKKGRDSIANGIQWIQEFEIIVHPRCTNFITEISNYQWDKDKFGQSVNKPVDYFNHLMDAMRYGLEKYIVEHKWLY